MEVYEDIRSMSDSDFKKLLVAIRKAPEVDSERMFPILKEIRNTKKDSDVIANDFGMYDARCRVLVYHALTHAEPNTNGNPRGIAAKYQCYLLPEDINDALRWAGAQQSNWGTGPVQ